ncbi:hypothetical protein [Campylobacter sp. MG1]|uniref:hypothetical protein n=1 Tax=Campylobacter sp. MG1 TaxID=2976332 RepID=UPI00226D11AF|nr:hypothetical protein [Campylobacter sp. MG1]
MKIFRLLSIEIKKQKIKKIVVLGFSIVCFMYTIASSYIIVKYSSAIRDMKVFEFRPNYISSGFDKLNMTVDLYAKPVVSYDKEKQYATLYIKSDLIYDLKLIEPDTNKTIISIDEISAYSDIGIGNLYLNKTKYLAEIYVKNEFGEKEKYTIIFTPNIYVIPTRDVWEELMYSYFFSYYFYLVK